MKESARTAASSPHGLPPRPTPLVGRGRDVQRLRARLLRRDVRLLTLTGPPGAGKTRLALDVAVALRRVFPDGLLFDEALEMFRELADSGGICLSLINLGTLARVAGDHQLATTLYDQSLVRYRELGDRRGTAFALLNLAAVAHRQTDEHRATALAGQSVALLQELGLRRHLPAGLELLAAAAARAEPCRAARLLGSAHALRQALGTPVPHADQAQYDSDLAAARGVADPCTFAECWREGASWPLDEAVGYGLTPEGAAVPGSVAGARSAGPPLLSADSLTATPIGTQVAAQWHHPPRASLSPREREVAVLIASGHTNRDIAAELVITEQTAAVHVKHILRKLELASCTQIAVWAVQHELAPTLPRRTTSSADAARLSYGGPHADEGGTGEQVPGLRVRAAGCRDHSPVR